MIAKTANTGAWNTDSQVFLAATLARALRIQQPPDYRENRLYVPARDTSRSLLLAKQHRTRHPARPRTQPPPPRTHRGGHRRIRGDDSTGRRMLAVERR
jgi:hypothetical protein